jgi:hypothetical protein
MPYQPPITASFVTNTPAGNIAATTVQAAINELDTEKAPLASPPITGDPTINGISVSSALNQRGTSGGIAFHGVAGEYAGVALNASCLIGTSSFSEVVKRVVPRTNPSAISGIISLSSGFTSYPTLPSGAFLYEDTNGSLTIMKRTASGVAKQIAYAAYVSTYGGQEVLISWAFNSATNTMTVCVNNAVVITDTDALWAESVTSAYLTVGMGLNDASRVATGVIDNILLYNRALSTGVASDISALVASGGVPAQADRGGSQVAQTSGTLTIGKRYRINTFVTGDSFTNVGAASNASGVEFIATGTTPTTWTNSSSLVKAGVIAYYPCNELTGSTIYDATANGNNMTLSGGAVLANPGPGTVPLPAITATSAQITALGATTPGTGAFTTLSASGVAALTTAAESWVGPTNTTGVYFKGSNVGIGTTGPVAKLHIGAENEPNMTSQSLFVSGSKSNYSGVAGLMQNQFLIYDDRVSTAGSGGAIGFGANTGSSQRTWIAAIDSQRDSATNDGTNYAGALVFHTRPAQSTPKERMRITSAGNVGIGTATITSGAKLEVSGTTASTTPITGTLVVGNLTAATTVGIGGGNVNAGGTITSGGSLAVDGTTAATAVNTGALKGANFGFSGALGGASFLGGNLNTSQTAANDNNLTVNGGTTGAGGGAYLNLNAGSTGLYAGTYLQLAGVNKWFIGTHASFSDGNYVVRNSTLNNNALLIVAGTNAATIAGSLAVGGGTPVVKILANIATLDFAEIAAGASADLTITVTGAVANSTVDIGLPIAPAAGIDFTAFVSAADTVTVRAKNTTGSAVDPASASYRAAVFNW